MNTSGAVTMERDEIEAMYKRVDELSKLIAEADAAGQDDAMAPLLQERVDLAKRLRAAGSTVDRLVRRARREAAEREFSYERYLTSPEWAKRRWGALERADHKCQLCSSPRRLEVHHRTYDRIGREDDDDLIVLCASCHRTFHENRRLER